MMVAEGATETNAEGLIFNALFPRIGDLVNENSEGVFESGEEIRWGFEESVGKIASIVS
jgi:hypothetical protein